MDSSYTQYKKFDANAHAENDNITKVAISGMLVAKGWNVVESGAYDLDFSCRRADGSTCHVEVDRRLSAKWGEGTAFPFPTYELGARKRKLLDDPNAVFVTANESLTNWIAAPARAFLTDGKLTEKDTRFGKDSFISLPVDHPDVRKGVL